LPGFGMTGRAPNQRMVQSNPNIKRKITIYAVIKVKDTHLMETPHRAKRGRMW